ncbi:DsbA family oxidoreductase [Roseateles asaccharophilus]|uniref:DsbA family dithiol-disulfide isomerase n=1 Tax=Roseateles asaccharophilus TaxID=582607 RepID=A0ABU2ABD2_9BURK|nr:DsbA family oxidoreductase [Roseateles asaccharophilus]MDR7334499.1 putative DsbA family dithiol-disulfide isomerase [Roseateles asaccharophilus]
MRIDFISDIVCPWCAIGLYSLEAAAARIPGLELDLHFHPFELNPGMAPEGQEIEEHLAQKYGASPAALAGTRAAIRERGAALGFDFRMEARSRIYNTRDAHRLLHWVDEAYGGARQRTLKVALLKAYFTDGRDVSDRAVLLELATAAGLPEAETRELLASDRYDADVSAAEAQVHGQGIHAVPAIVINQRHLIQGGQSVEVFEKLLRQVMADAA